MMSLKQPLKSRAVQNYDHEATVSGVTIFFMLEMTKCEHIRSNNR